MRKVNSTTTSDVPAFLTLLQLYEAMVRDAKQYSIKSAEVESGSYTLHDHGSTVHRLQQPIVITDHQLHAKCTRAEWDLLRHVMMGMHEYNALWKANNKEKARNSSYRTALLGLQAKGLLIPTETKHIYIVNPVHIRRGDPFGVVATTANMLVNRKPTDDMLIDKRPVKQFQFSLPPSDLS